MPLWVETSPWHTTDAPEKPPKIASLLENQPVFPWDVVCVLLRWLVVKGNYGPGRTKCWPCRYGRRIWPAVLKLMSCCLPMCLSRLLLSESGSRVSQMNLMRDLLRAASKGDEDRVARLLEKDPTLLLEKMKNRKRRIGSGRRKIKVGLWRLLPSMDSWVWPACWYREVSMLIPKDIEGRRPCTGLLRRAIRIWSSFFSATAHRLGSWMTSS